MMLIRQKKSSSGRVISR